MITVEAIICAHFDIEADSAIQALDRVREIDFERELPDLQGTECLRVRAVTLNEDLEVNLPALTEWVVY